VETLTTAYRISPFLAQIDPPPAWPHCSDEIAEVLEVAVDDLAETGGARRGDGRSSGVAGAPTASVFQARPSSRLGRDVPHPAAATAAIARWPGWSRLRFTPLCWL